MESPTAISLSSPLILGVGSRVAVLPAIVLSIRMLKITTLVVITPSIICRISIIRLILISHIRVICIMWKKIVGASSTISSTRSAPTTILVCAST